MDKENVADKDVCGEVNSEPSPTTKPKPETDEQRFFAEKVAQFYGDVPEITPEKVSTCIIKVSIYLSAVFLQLYRNGKLSFENAFNQPYQS